MRQHRRILLALALSAWAGTSAVYAACDVDADCTAPDEFCQNDVSIPMGCTTVLSLSDACTGKEACCPSGSECRAGLCLAVVPTPPPVCNLGNHPMYTPAPPGPTPPPTPSPPRVPYGPPPRVGGGGGPQTRSQEHRDRPPQPDKPHRKPIFHLPVPNRLGEGAFCSGWEACCIPGTYCKRVSATMSVCSKGVTPVSTPQPPPPPPPPPACPAQLPLNGLCAGSEHCCATGLSCFYIHAASPPNYQCRAALPPAVTCPAGQDRLPLNFQCATLHDKSLSGCCEDGLICLPTSVHHSQCEEGPPTPEPLPCVNYIRAGQDCLLFQHCCEVGSSCSVVDEWNAVCVADPDTPAPPACALPLLGQWGVCTATPHCCRDGLVCVNKGHYKDCQPPPITPAPPTVPLCGSLVPLDEPCGAEPGCCTYGTSCVMENGVALCKLTPGALPCSGGKSCVKRSALGEPCGGFGLPCVVRKCALGLRCSAMATGPEGVCEA